MMKRGGSNDDDITKIVDDNILCEIISRLPVQSIMQLNCVCKHWRSLIQQNLHLHLLHLRRSKTRPPHLLALLPDKECCFYKVNLFGKEAREIELHAINCGTIICPSINGLICFVDSAMAAVRIYNLSTRKATPWIKTELNMLKVNEKENGDDGIRYKCFPTYVLGFDPATNAHKVICVWKIHDYQRSQGPFISKYIACNVLTVGDNSWRKINDVPPFETFQGDSVYVNGSIYWCTLQYTQKNCPSECPSIIAFDVGNEKFRMIPIPKFMIDVFHSAPQYQQRFAGLLDVGGSLAILVHIMRNSTIVLWMFHDDKKQNSTSTTDGNSNTNWVQQTISVPLPHRQMPLYFIGSLNGQIIIRCGPLPPKFLLSYDLRTEVVTVVQINDNIYSIMKRFPLVLITPTIDSLWPIPQKQQQPQHKHTQLTLES